MNARSDLSSDDASGAARARFYQCEADPRSASWVRWTVGDRSRFNGQFGVLLSRLDGDTAIVRLQPHHGLANIFDNVHGGAIMGFIDVAMFVGAAVLGIADAHGGLTVDMNVQFVRGADVGQPLDMKMVLTRETKRLLFVRGTAEQADAIVSSFAAILRKAR